MKSTMRGGCIALLGVFLLLFCALCGCVADAEESPLSDSALFTDTLPQTEFNIPRSEEPIPQTEAETDAETEPEEKPETEAAITSAAEEVPMAEIPPETEAVIETEPLPLPEEEIPETAAAFPVSSLVPMTGDLPIIPVREDSPDLTAEIRDGRVILPSLIGCRRENICVTALSDIHIEFAEDWYPLPAGVIYAASFTGEMTEDTFRILPDSTLTLHVSLGMGPYISVLTEESRQVYLTFDDGPHPSNTESILDTLDQYGIKATFFMVGSYIDRYPEVARAVYEHGHKIGCHSYTHNYNSIYKNASAMMAEVTKWENAVTNAIGHIPPERLFRYPGGSTNCKNQNIYNALLEAGYRIFDWNALNNDCLLHTRPADQSDLDFMKESFIETIAYSFRLKSAPHIILMHDSYAQTAELLPWIIEYLQDLGCTFGTPDELPAGWHY